MKDLYKRIGIPLPTDDVGAIRAANNSRDLPLSVRQSVLYILLNPRRKEVYDRNHKVMRTIGRIRANLGLQHTEFWLAGRCEDFNYEPDSSSEAQGKTEETGQSQPSHSRSASSLTVRAVLASLFGHGILVTGLLLIAMPIIFSIWPRYTSRNPDPGKTRYTYPRDSNKGKPNTEPDIARRPQFTFSEPQLTFSEPQLTFSEPELPLPSNGQVTRQHVAEAIAPFEIKTRAGSGNYYAKLVSWGTNQAVLTVFIRDGQSAKVDVPLGSYELKYAVGKTWYGSEHLFGPKTACSRADEKFTFKRNGLQVSGYTVELYLQIDGNLQTERIPVSEF